MRNTLWGVPINDVVYAVPVLVWLTSFGATHIFSPALLRNLSMRFNLCPTYPTVDPADMDLPENVATMAAAMAEVAAAASSSSTAPMPTSEDLWLSALGAQRRRYVSALLRHARQLGAYWLDVLCERDSDISGRWGGRTFSTLASCFTALCVHSCRASLTSSVFIYLHTLSIGKRCTFRYEAITDLAGAVGAAMLTNALLLATTHNMDCTGAQVLSREALAASHPVLRWVRALLPLVQAGLLVMSTGSVSVNLRNRFDDYGAGSTVPPPPPPGYGVDSSDRSDPFSRVAATGGVLEDGGYRPEHWARAAGAVAVTSPDPIPTTLSAPAISRPPIALVCGGEVLAYAFSGFRFTYRGDTAQLKGAAWCFWMDSLQRYLNLQLRRSSRGGTDDGDSVGGAAAAAAAAGVVGLIASDSSPFTSVDPTTRDVYLTASSSEALNRQNIIGFLMGCGVGLAVQQAPVAVKLARRTPVISLIVNRFSPPPPPAINVPDGLMEATLTDLGVVRLYFHSHRRQHQYQQQGQGADADIDAADSISSDGSVGIVSTPLLDGGSTAPTFPPTRAATANDSTRQATADERAVPAFVDIPVPPQCFCPITRCLMRDPVKTVDGFTYDREAIEAWLQRRPTSPMTNLLLSDCKLAPDHEVHALVVGIVERYNAFVAAHHRSDSRRRSTAL